MMTFSRLIAGLLTVSLLLAVSSNAQKMHTTTMELDADQVFIIPGLGAIISQENDTLKVLMVPPAEGRSKEFKNVNLEQGDIILMCNGKRTKTVEALKEAIEPVAIGADLKFGIRRDGKMIMTSLPKAKAEDMSNMQIMTMTSGDDGDGGTKTMTKTMGDGGKTVTRTMHGGGGGMAALVEIGALLSGMGGNVAIMGLIDNVKPDIANYNRAEGDIIKSINGTAVSSLADFNNVYENLNEDQPLEFEVEQNGQTIKVSLKKGRKMKTMTRRKGSN